MPPQKDVLASTAPPSNATSFSADSDNCPEGNGDVSSISKGSLISPPATLCTLVMIDMLSVSLVVPLLHQYYKACGVQSARQREMLSSLFSSSQILGGILIGALSDLGVLSSRRVLLLSFLGSAVSYFLLIEFGGGIYQLICSRVIVGLVKQTMTVSTSLIVQYTDSDNRTFWMGRLGAATTASWILGPSIGGLLFKHAGPVAPAACACVLFLFNSIIAAVLLPKEDTLQRFASTQNVRIKTTNKKRPSLSSFFANLKTCFSSGALASIVVSLLLFGWVARTTSYASMASFYEEKYGIEPHARGYIKSYQMCLNFLIQSFLVQALLSLCGGERNAACIAAFTLSFATFCEINASFSIFAGLVCPLVAASVEMISVSLRSLLTQVAPTESLSSVLAALDVLQNAASISVPFYRTLLFSFLMRVSGHEDLDATMTGDPEPKMWLLSSSLHWVGFACIITWLLLSYKTAADRSNITDKKER